LQKLDALKQLEQQQICKKLSALNLQAIEPPMGLDDRQAQQIPILKPPSDKFETPLGTGTDISH
jgi:hypothetical protein